MDLHQSALNIKKALPWIPAEQDVINHLQSIPQDKFHLRNHLTLYHFIKQKNSMLPHDFDNIIQVEANEIAQILRDVPIRIIKENLSILGDIPNRKEVVIRQLIYKNQDKLNKTFDQINARRKRNSTSVVSINSNDPDVKIKIRKTNDCFEVVSTFNNNNNNKDNLISPDSSFSPENCPSSSVKGDIENTDYDKFLLELNNCLVGSSEGTIIASEELVPVQEAKLHPFENYDEFLLEMNNCLVGTSEETIIASQELVPVQEAKLHPLEDNINSNSFVSENQPQLPGSSNCLIQPNMNISATKKLHNPSLECLDQPSTSKSDIPRRQMKNIVTSGSTSCDEAQNRPSTPKLYDAPWMEQTNRKWPIYAPQNTCTNIPTGSTFCAGQNGPSTSNIYESPVLGQINGISPVLTQQNTASGSLFAEAENVPSTSKRFKSFPLLDDTKEISPIYHAQQNISKYSNCSIISKPKEYDLVSHLTEVTGKPAEYVRVYCNRNAVPLNKKPSKDTLNYIISKLIMVETLSDSECDSPSCDLFDSDESCDEPIHQKETPIVDLTSPVPDSNTDCPILTNRIKEMFPEACPKWVQKICKNKTLNHVDDIVTYIIMNDDYPRRIAKAASPERELDPEEQYAILKEILSDADPTYLRMQCDKFRNDPDGLKEFTANALENRTYPSLKDYIRKQQLSAQQKQYTDEFKIENFLKLFPNPSTTFEDPKRKVEVTGMDLHYLTIFLRNKFDRLYVNDIAKVMISCSNRPYVCYKALEKFKDYQLMKSKRKPSPLPNAIQNIPLLQEIAYIQNITEIRLYLKKQKQIEQKERQLAKEQGTMETCNCCFDDEIMPKDCYTCDNGCKFCKDCILKSCEVAMGDGVLEFSCLSTCDGHFTLSTLQNVLPPKMFSKMAQKKALAEVKAAGIEDLEMCPFCDFATIPYETDKIFRCLNSECMKESCRLCKEPSHVPLKCDEVERDQDVKARTYVENKMTEALLRKCWKCGTSFFKDEGCNKMTCSCGASMCYICSKPVRDYTHFNGIGGDKFELCPLYSDTNALNEQNVLKGAEQAKAEVNPKQLKIDPSADVKNHYKARAKKLPVEPHLALLNRAQNVPVPNLADQLEPLVRIRDLLEERYANLVRVRMVDGRRHNHRQ